MVGGYGQPVGSAAFNCCKKSLLRSHLFPPSPHKVVVLGNRIDEKADIAGEGTGAESLLDEMGEEKGVFPFDEEFKAEVVFDFGIA